MVTLIAPVLMPSFAAAETGELDQPYLGPRLELKSARLVPILHPASGATGEQSMLDADAILHEAEAREAGVRPLRRAIREDAGLARDWSRQKALGARDAVQAEPVKATLYALGLGVVIGLLIAR